VLHTRCLHGYHGPVTIVAVIAPVAQVRRATTRAMSNEPRRASDVDRFVDGSHSQRPSVRKLGLKKTRLLGGLPSSQLRTSRVS
jgi:hypothetical protein